MGKIKEGFLGGVSGTVGDLVGASWKGIDYIRSKAKSYNNPRTDKQQATRKAFGKLAKLSKTLLLTVIRPIWDKGAVNKTGCNVFISTNIKKINPDIPLADNPDLVISIGSLPLPENLTVQRNIAVPCGTIICWTDNSGSLLATAEDISQYINKHFKL